VVGDGSVVSLDSDGVIVVPTEGRLVALLDVHDLVVVDTPDAVVVCRRDRVQDVKKLTELLRETRPRRLRLTNAPSPAPFAFAVQDRDAHPAQLTVMTGHTSVHGRSRARRPCITARDRVAQCITDGLRSDRCGQAGSTRAGRVSWLLPSSFLVLPVMKSA